ncbi:flagellar biosynthesis anti-sigma factor FlgM [Geobacillus thermoleovorans]|uniref:Negative regulator of flagellin synthesis n=1 Tax=Geobacillus thermoleovorans TaxID=33941 RepID=A0A2Z3N764_GEOTH|nr:flagellar biosynthesis anti-sigma factor FlgM [Geobacillus thermoleovorans]AWO74722.1 flagellar biosynthesis anti-sigma factor FlgM [Geobacillus thermoleovorans]MBW7642868.1 flagellar biosynthesis anti-sigma factor FlgM [Geobacillus thermoleovorans]QHN50463.1 flagellar biosynthesis anti-sigma factor FlgM [Geobacillus stearothermophilus]
MKIHHIGPAGVNPYQRQLAKTERLAAGKTKGDQVEISKEAKELQEATSWERARQAKLEELRQQIETGAYQVDPRAVAKRMIDYYRNHR